MRYVDLLHDSYKQLMHLGAPIDGSMKVNEVEGLEGVRLGVDSSGCAVILPPDLSSDAQNQELEHIVANPRVAFDVDRESDVEVEEVSMVMTKSHDDWLIETFLGLIGILLDSAVSEGRLDGAHSFVQDLVSLFRSMTQPGRKEAQGLWAELFLIDRSASVDTALAAWHSKPNDRFDFALGAERVEVKSTTGPRIHRFSHAQLTVNNIVTVTVASFVLDHDAEGSCCADLVESIVARCNDDMLKKQLLCQVVETLGDGWRSQTSVRFDVDLADQNLRFFAIEDIPRITSPLPPNVVDVSYRSDLQVAPALDPAAVGGAAPLLRNFCGDVRRSES